MFFIYFINHIPIILPSLLPSHHLPLHILIRIRTHFHTHTHIYTRIHLPPPMDNFTSILGSIPSLENLIKSQSGSLVLTSHPDKPLLVPCLILLPFLIFSLVRLGTTSSVALTHHRDPATIRLYNPRTGKVKTADLMDYIKKKCPSLSDPARALFRPTLWMTSGHLQTAYAAYRDFGETYIINYDR